MEILLFTIALLVMVYYSAKKLYKWSGGGGDTNTPEPTIKKEKQLKYLTADFKVKKKIEDGEEVKPYPVPESNAVNFYEKNSYGGEGFIHKEFNKNLWDIINANRDTSATITRTNKNEAYIKVLYK